MVSCRDNLAVEYFACKFYLKQLNYLTVFKNQKLVLRISQFLVRIKNVVILNPQSHFSTINSMETLIMGLPMRLLVWFHLGKLKFYYKVNHKSKM